MKRKSNQEVAESGTKRVRRTVNAKDETDYFRQCADLLDVLRTHKTEDGRILCSSFLRAPSRRTDPEYFKVVTQPIDLTRIQQKVKTEEYSSFADFCADIHLLISNSKKYYKDDSREFKDACELSDLFDEKRHTAGDEVDEIAAPSNSLNDSWSSAPIETESIGAEKDDGAVETAQLEDIIASTLELTDDTGRLLSPPFRVLVSEEELPSYYARIKNPIDLKTIAQRIRGGEYEKWSDFDVDFRLMCKNAKVFNETGSVINKDASALLKNYKKRRADLCHPDCKPLSAKRIKANAATVDELLSMEAMDDEIEGLSEDSEEDEETETAGDLRWKLYWAVRNEPNPDDPEIMLSEPFLALPSKSYYPDYYNEISSPMSFFVINKRLKRGEYGSLSEVLADITLIFENARSYNIEGSEIHDAAITLEKFAVSKARSLQPEVAKPRIAVEDTPTTPKPPRQHKPKRKRIKPDPEMSITSSPHNSEASSSMMRIGNPFGNSTPVRFINSAESNERPGRPGRKSMSELLSRYRDRLRMLWNAAYGLLDGNRRIADAFMMLPSRHEYPQYYDVIERPIDLFTVKRRIDEDRYTSSEEFLEDIRLLFNNARTFNEPGSQIYRDASTLEATVFATHNSFRDAPLMNPVHLKAQYGWLRTKLAPRDRIRPPPIGERILGTRDPTDSDSDMTRGSPAKFIGSMKRSVGGSDSKLSAMFINSSSIPSSRHGSSSNLAPSSSNSLHYSLIELFNLVKSFCDPKGRNLAEAFLHLPSKQEYPDYYDVIKKPIDFAKIGSRISSNHYDSIDALISDFTLMFDNACRYNEPESTIYKDALSLQKLVLQKKRELCKSTTNVDVALEIRSLLTSLLVSVTNHQDRDGRCYSDSLAEVPALLKKRGVKLDELPFSLDEMKKNIDKGRYRRLDRFQDDLFALFDAARENSRSDSQLFEDSVELQMHYIKVRDDLTKDFLISPARHYTERTLLNAVTELRKEKLPEEKKHDEENVDKQTLGTRADGDIDLDQVGQGGYLYHIHDYAYISPAADESASRNHIMRIERIFKDSDGNQFARGFWCYRPEETYHLATKKFLENEVFFTSYFDTITTDRLSGKCHVMSIRHFMKEKPKGFADKDVYVCESRYMGRQLHFKKIKHWPYKKEEDNVEYEKRDQPLLSISRVASVFATEPPQAGTGTTSAQDVDTEDTQESICSSSDDERMRKLPAVLDKQRVEVLVPRQETQKEGSGDKKPLFYEQMEHHGRWYQLGDFVHVYNPLRNRTVVLRIDKMWKAPDGDAMFSGPYFAQPREIEHEPTRMFYKRELFAVLQPDITVPMDSIQEQCAVLLLKDYTKMRPTEIEESLVYVVEFEVFGSEPPGNQCSLHGTAFGVAKKMSMDEAAKKSTADEAANKVSTDETLNKSSLDEAAKKPSLDETAESSNGPSTSTTFAPKGELMSETSAQKVKTLKAYHLSSEVLEHELLLFKTPITMEKEMSPLLMRADSSAVPMEPIDDMDETASESLDGGEPTGKQELVSWLASQPKLNARSKSGYILFSAEIRKRIMQENPEAGFGEVSKIVGVEWKKLTEEQKKQYEVRAEYIASERAKQEAREPVQFRLQPGQIRVFMCKWQTCDFQFDSADGLYEHVKTSHTSQIVDGENQYVCLWTSCLKYRKEGKPFPSLPRLHRHIKEKHLNSSAKSIYPNQRSKNFYTYQQVPTTAPAPTSAPIPGTTYIAVQQQAAPNGQQQYTISPAPVTGYVTGTVVASSNQIVTNGYVNGTAAAYVATAAPTVVHSGTAVQGYHPYPQQVRQVATVAQPVLATGAPQYTAVAVQPVGYGTASTSQQQPQSVQQQAAVPSQGTIISDPGRTVVQAPRPPEPVFVAPPNSIQVKRVLHSEAYLRYIESMHHGVQRTVSKWNRSMLSNRRNTSSQKPLPINWLREAKDSGAREEEVVNALWRLRENLLQDAANIASEAGAF